MAPSTDTSGAGDGQPTAAGIGIIDDEATLGMLPVREHGALYGSRVPSPMNEDALFDMLVDDNALSVGPSFLLPTDNHGPLGIPLLRPPGGDFTPLSTMMLPDDNGNMPLSDPAFSLPVDDDAPFGMSACNDDPLLLGASFSPAADGIVPQGLTMMPIEGNSLVPSPPLQEPWSLNLPPVVNNSPGSPSFQLPEPDATAFGIPPWPTTIQGSTPDPFAPIELGHVLNPPWDQAPLPEGFGNLHPPGPSMMRPSAAAPGLSAPALSVTNPPPIALDSPQPPSQEAVRFQGEAHIARKRVFDQSHLSTTRPTRQLSNIRPKPLPAFPGSAGSTSAKTPSHPPPKLDVKQSNVPADMLTTFKLEGPGITHSPNARTRSTRVCLKCQTMHRKVSY